MSVLCQTLPFAFKRLLYTVFIERSIITKRFVINRYPIADILYFIFVVETDYNLQPNVRLLHGQDTDPQSNASL